jgi:hypothetical protein
VAAGYSAEFGRSTGGVVNRTTIGCGFGAPTNLNFRQLKDANGNFIISNNPGVPFQMQLGARFQF